MTTDERQQAQDNVQDSTHEVDVRKLQREIAQLMVDSLNLEIAPEQIDPQAPLFGAGSTAGADGLASGLGLDSIDLLEISLEVSKRYGLQLRADDEHNTQIFATLASLSHHIARHRTA